MDVQENNHTCRCFWCGEPAVVMSSRTLCPGTEAEQNSKLPECKRCFWMSTNALVDNNSPLSDADYFRELSRLVRRTSPSRIENISYIEGKDVVTVTMYGHFTPISIDIAGLPVVEATKKVFAAISASGHNK